MENECDEIVEMAEGPSVCVSEHGAETPHRAGMVQEESAYGTKIRVDLSYERTLDVVRSTLADEGFLIAGDMELRDKLGFRPEDRFPRYTVLSVMDPELARAALDLDLDSGLLLTWTVGVQELVGGAIVDASDPIVLFELIDGTELREIGLQGKRKLQTVLNRAASYGL